MTEFEGTIGRTLADSEPHFAEPPHPAEDAPNVVIVLLDDTGFAQFGCYGSDIDTPNVDALAAGGLQFTNFHVTPLCSPTRAALLTGRSQHAVGMRGVSNWRTGFPHQLGHISNSAATIAEVLQSEGYATFCAGKWHLAPTQDISAAGPFDQWPLARGFDRYYGFLEGETDQFHPELVRDNSHIDPPATPEEGYHVSEDLIDQLLQMITDSKGVRPDRPFFAYLPFGATHAPHQAPQTYLDKYRGRYDEGWDVVRERWYRRQLELGVIPSGTELAPRNPGVEAWDDMPEAQRRLACRLQEAFAAFLDHTDDQIGQPVGFAVGQIGALRRVGAEVVELPWLGVEVIALRVFRHRLPPCALALGDQGPAAAVLEVLERVDRRRGRIGDDGGEGVARHGQLIDAPVRLGGGDAQQLVDRRGDVGDVDELGSLGASLIRTETVGPVHDHRHVDATLVGVLLIPPEW